MPATWDEVHVIDGLPMRHITLARRSGKDWYVGSLTNWEERDTRVPLNFLGEGKYVAEIYADAPDAAAMRPTLPLVNGRSIAPRFSTYTWFPAAATLSGSIRPSHEAKGNHHRGHNWNWFWHRDRDARCRLRCNRDRADR